MSWQEPRTASGVARKRYNDSLQDYNTFVRQFPNSIWAGMSGFQVNNAYFAAIWLRRLFLLSASMASARQE